MNNYNVFDLLIAVVFNMSPQLGVLGPKDQYLGISFCLGELEALPKFHLKALQIRSKIFLSQDQTGQINNLIGKYIMEMSKLKHVQRYVTTFELDYRKFEHLPQIQQLSTIFTPQLKNSLKP